jgi:hypothetical protein
VLFSSSTTTVDRHYCCDELVDASIFHKAKTCGMEGMESSPKNCSVNNDDCCTTHTFTKKGSDDLKQVVFDLETDQVVFVEAFIYSYLNLFKGIEEKVIRFLHYSPPLISKDILVLHETFLI